MLGLYLYYINPLVRKYNSSLCVLAPKTQRALKNFLKLTLTRLQASSYLALTFRHKEWPVLWRSNPNSYIITIA
jgi:hypothetical protein